MTDSTTVTKTSGLTVINLKVTKEGNIERKMTDVSPQAQLNNTLLEALCPGIRVASVTVTLPLNATYFAPFSLLAEPGAVRS